MEKKPRKRLGAMRPFKAKALVYCLLASLAGHSQQRIQTPDDAYKLKNDTGFQNKPLKTLLKEIGPEIKMVTVDPDASDERPACIIFRFVDRTAFNHYRCAEQFPVSIIVRIKEPFLWGKTKDNYFIWTKEDAERLGGLTIAFLGVHGKMKRDFRL